MNYLVKTQYLNAAASMKAFCVLNVKLILYNNNNLIYFL